MIFRPRMNSRRIVLDTHIWLDWLVFKDLSLLKLKKEVADGRAEVFIDAACEAELERVLAYDLARHTLDAAARADVLVTKDHKLLELARRTKAFRILNPRKF